MRTFFLSPDEWDRQCTLRGSEAHHMIKVLRMRAGDTCRILDGKGREGLFIIRGMDKNSVQLELAETVMHPEPHSRAYIALGWGKSVRRSWIFEKAVELEAAGIWLWQAARSQSKMPDMTKESWHSQLIAGAKQCVNPWIPELKSVAAGVTGLVELAQGFDRKFILWEGEAREALLSGETLGSSGDTLFVIGPEGGFADDEVSLLKESGFAAASLGNRILRWETAALLCLGLHFWSKQR
ncbi:16S rRNA (uracil(1498)-N(3))-methyltransferase [Oleidesulfovibrio alaskensis]|uniref:16S rRNA (uracil(1498)-N(3))-methyltransferase n=1 Tax=Oleidesulfovibrio alaskensis TaxID=58180 RepID=UPI001A37D94A|nr:16S rRNA (uracil(1498)-N(3))-methyltransferase [Oleidesulfovibrio alaskensis]MBL3582673.1 16S rRNA (uracil(1498)-N(3))-methyltransferase [Oleidesulfovibrio alaskensis]